MISSEEVLDRAWARVEADDIEGARRLLRAHLAERPDDDVVQAALDSLDDPDTLLSSEPAVEPEPDARHDVDQDGLALKCLNCGHAVTDFRRAMLNTRGLSFFGFDDLNHQAGCHGCDVCGLIHWFLPAAPGALQAMHPAVDAPSTEPHGRGCMVCGYDRFFNVRSLVNTRGLSFLGLDFLNRSLQAAGCHRCGHLHWHEGESWVPGPSPGPPQPPVEVEHVRSQGIRCLGCGGQELRGQRALLNSRGLTHFGLDFLDEGSRVFACDGCRLVQWFRQVS